jgi:tetratricopeptide (TPR) repeat protein
LNNLGSLHQKKGLFTKALEYFENGLKILEEVYGEKHMDIATTLINRCGVYQQQKLFEMALPLYVRALMILVELLGTYHAYVAGKKKIFNPISFLKIEIFVVTLNDIAILCFNMGYFDESEEMYKIALTLYDRVFGKSHPGIVELFFLV